MASKVRRLCAALIYFDCVGMMQVSILSSPTLRKPRLCVKVTLIVTLDDSHVMYLAGIKSAESRVRTITLNAASCPCAGVCLATEGWHARADIITFDPMLFEDIHVDRPRC